VLSPREAIVAGGPAEEFERRVQGLFREGHHHLVTDLSGVPELDSAGVRALVRGHTTAQRLGGSFKLVGLDARARSLLQVAHLDSVLEVYDSLESAEAGHVPWPAIRLIAAGSLLVLALVWGGIGWSGLQMPEEIGPLSQPATRQELRAHQLQPFIELSKLVAAAAIGMLVTAVHTRYRREKALSPSMEQAQILLCVAGAMVMIIIGNSLARAFGIAGAAGVIRFRTPVDDPRDMTIIFLLMALGMSAGLGAFAVAGLGTMFLCLFLVVLDRVGAHKPRSMMIELAADGREFPTSHVASVFARNHVVFEPREMSQGKELVLRYFTTLGPDISLEDLSEQLIAGGKAGVKSVSWEPPKKSEC
jgi:anti-anti-sigma factor